MLCISSCFFTSRQTENRNGTGWRSCTTPTAATNPVWTPLWMAGQCRRRPLRRHDNPSQLRRHNNPLQLRRRHNPSQLRCLQDVQRWRVCDDNHPWRSRHSDSRPLKLFPQLPGDKLMIFAERSSVMLFRILQTGSLYGTYSSIICLYILRYRTWFHGTICSIHFYQPLLIASFISQSLSWTSVDVQRTLSTNLLPLILIILHFIYYMNKETTSKQTGNLQQHVKYRC